MSPRPDPLAVLLAAARQSADPQAQLRIHRFDSDGRPDPFGDRWGLSDSGPRYSSYRFTQLHEQGLIRLSFEPGPQNAWLYSVQLTEDGIESARRAAAEVAQ